MEGTVPARLGRSRDLSRPLADRLPAEPDASPPTLHNYCTYADQLVWSTAGGGVPTLAVDTSLFQGQESSYSDFIAGPDGEPLEQVSDGQTPYWLYQDPSGNHRVMEDSGGNIVSVGNYPPYGQATGIASPLQYSGSYTDAYTGLVYDQARWYDPGAGQFLSQDPDVDQTLQPYAYAGDSPTTNDDPTGLAPCAEAVGDGRAGVDAVGCPGGGVSPPPRDHGRKCAGGRRAALQECPPSGYKWWRHEADFACLGGQSNKNECTGDMGIGGRVAYGYDPQLRGGGGWYVQYFTARKPHCSGGAGAVKGVDKDFDTTGDCSDRKSSGGFKLTTRYVVAAWACLRPPNAEEVCDTADTFYFDMKGTIDALGRTASYSFKVHLVKCDGTCSPPDLSDCGASCDPWAEIVGPRIPDAAVFRGAGGAQS